ncbi:hypothetical protein [Providencia sp. Je.9.19]|uniref:hypothetical protein n=1 Tax=Providencia sp. Je.9.19 TaxID=3142844 RepID=UPI003DA936B1
MTAYRAEFFTLEDVKRLKVIHDKRDNTRSQDVLAGNEPSRRHTENKPQHTLNNDDMIDALIKHQTRSIEIFRTNKI